VLGAYRAGKDAARATLVLMDDVANVLPPRTILECYEKHLDDGHAPVSTQDAMWEELGDQTADVMVRGARTLAMTWDAAWAVGNGGGVTDEQLGAVDQSEVQRRYVDTSFVPSLTLEQAEAQLQVPGGTQS